MEVFLRGCRVWEKLRLLAQHWSSEAGTWEGTSEDHRNEGAEMEGCEKAQRKLRWHAGPGPSEATELYCGEEPAIALRRRSILISSFITSSQVIWQTELGPPLSFQKGCSQHSASGSQESLISFLLWIPSLLVLDAGFSPLDLQIGTNFAFQF